MARTARTAPATEATPTEAPEAITAEAPAPKAPKAPKPKAPCACRAWSATAPAADIAFKHRAFITHIEDGIATLETGCTQTTGARFAPGHDARLAGMLQTAARLGGEATITDGGLAISGDPAALAADVLGAALGRKVAYTAPTPE